MLTGVAVRAVKMVSADHPLKTTPPPLSAGKLYVRAPASEWRTSKSDGPRSISGLSFADGVENEESFEAMSMECDQV
jgi:hypothetical protein